MKCFHCGSGHESAACPHYVREATPGGYTVRARDAVAAPLRLTPEAEAQVVEALQPKVGQVWRGNDSGALVTVEESYTADSVAYTTPDRARFVVDPDSFVKRFTFDAAATEAARVDALRKSAKARATGTTILPSCAPVVLGSTHVEVGRALASSIAAGERRYKRSPEATIAIKIPPMDDATRDATIDALRRLGTEGQALTAADYYATGYDPAKADPARAVTLRGIGPNATCPKCGGPASLLLTSIACCRQGGCIGTPEERIEALGMRCFEVGASRGRFYNRQTLEAETCLVRESYWLAIGEAGDFSAEHPTRDGAIALWRDRALTAERAK